MPPGWVNPDIRGIEGLSVTTVCRQSRLFLEDVERLVWVRSRRLVLLKILFDRNQLLRGTQICDFPDVNRQSPSLPVVLTIDELLNVPLSQRTIDYQAFCPVRKIECRCEFPAMYTHPANRFSLLGNLV